MKPIQVVWLGCGDIGVRAAALGIPFNWRLLGVRRHPEQLPNTIEGIAADYTCVELLDILEPIQPDYVVMSPLPAGRDAAGYERGYLEPVRRLAASGWLARARYGVFISSTRVYAENNGAPIDESAPLTTSDANGMAIATAETTFLEAIPAGAVLRASGLYGNWPGMLLTRVARGEASANPERNSNRIHRDDLARAVWHLLTEAEHGRVHTGPFNASDDTPTAIGEVEAWLARQLGVVLQATAAPSLFGRSNRQVDNARLRATGFEFSYPDYRSGFGAMLAGNDAKSL